MMKALFFLAVAVLVSSCDVEGEIRQGDISSTIAPNSGSAGGNAPVLGGVFFDSLEGLKVSSTGSAGQILVLNSTLEPQWITSTVDSAAALPISGGDMTGNINLNGNFLSGDTDNEGIFVDSLGSVGIGTTNPTHELHVEGNAFKTVGGTAWVTVSDRRLKKNIRAIGKGLSHINRLKLKEFEYKNNKQLGLLERHDSGLIAQEVAEIFPESVLYSGQYLMLDYHPIYMAQLRAVQELSQQNESLERRLADLEKKMKIMLNN